MRGQVKRGATVDVRSIVLLESVAANEFVITVLVPFLVTFLAIFVNWLVHSDHFEWRHAMIGSDLVICFVAIAAIHFFKVYRDNFVHHMDVMRIADLMLATFVISLVTIPLLLICVGMERAVRFKSADISWPRIVTNILVGASPLALAALALAN